ncbi:MAG TPA: hypothetical protein VHH34_12640 [Pseudonocardiaceae bacterium]|nr:hypothetical protein [Pseudonocardiaceae bacterium]
MLEGLAALATAGGTALAAAMATDAWQSTRSAVVRLFGRDSAPRQATIETQLDCNATLVAQAEEPDAARQSLAGVWRLELESLLRRHPEAEDELRALITQIHNALPAAQQTWVQTNIARDQARQNIVQHGTLHVHPGDTEPDAR